MTDLSALAEKVEGLCAALAHARETIELLANVASDATQTRHDVSDDLAMIDAALLRAKGASNG